MSFASMSGFPATFDVLDQAGVTHHCTVTYDPARLTLMGRRSANNASLTTVRGPLKVVALRDDDGEGPLSTRPPLQDVVEEPPFDPTPPTA